MKYYNKRTYNEKDTNTIEIKPGDRMFCDGERSAFKIESRLNILGWEATIDCDESGMWSVYVVKRNEVGKSADSKSLNSVTSDKVLNYGEIIEDSGEYDAFYSDAPGGQFTQLKIVKHNGKFYVYKEKVIEGMDLSQKRECIAFYELK